MVWSESEESGEEFERTKHRKCTFCDQTLKNQDEVPDHELKCIVGKNSKLKKTKLKNHIEKFICDICCSSYTFLQKFKEHIRKHEPPGGFICIYCDMNFCSKFQLGNHLEKVHSIYMCCFCREYYGSVDDYIIHKSKMHEDFTACKYCCHPFKTLLHLQFHLSNNCGEKMKYKCPICHKLFQTEGSLREHEENHVKANCLSKSKEPKKTQTNRRTCRNNKKTHENDIVKNSDATPATRKSMRIKKEVQYDEDNDVTDSIINNLITSVPIKVEPDIVPDSVSSTPDNDDQNPSKCSEPSNNSEYYIKNENDENDDNDETQSNSIDYESDNNNEDNAESSDNEPLKKSVVVSSGRKKKNKIKLESNRENEKPFGKESFECIFCSNSFIQFQKLTSYTKHLQKEHKKNNDEISEILRSIDSIQLELFCKICGRYYKSTKTLECHIKLHGPNGDLTIYCSCCKLYLPASTNLETHMVELHLDRVKCKICGKQYKNYESLHMHVMNSHEKKRQTRSKKTFMCNKCGKCVSSKRQLEDHESSDCGQNPIYQCKVCGKCLTTAGILKQHLRTHSIDNLHHCKYCNKGFAAKGNLDRHERSHTGERPYSCTFCDKAFAYQENLFIHLSTHTGIKRYMCVTCSERFSCISGLKCHWKTNATTCGADPNRSTKAVGEYIGFRKGKIVHEKEH